MGKRNKNGLLSGNRELLGVRLLILICCLATLCLYTSYSRVPSRLRVNEHWRTCALCPDGSVLAGLPATGPVCSRRESTTMPPSWATAVPALNQREQPWVVTSAECEAVLRTFLPFRHQVVAASDYTLVDGAHAPDPLVLLTKEVRGAVVGDEERFLFKSVMPRRVVWYGSPLKACLPPPTVARGADPARACPHLYITHTNRNSGRHHNQLQSLINTFSLARRLNRTVVLPPFCTDSPSCDLGVSPTWLYSLDSLAAAGYCFITYVDFERRLVAAYNATREAVHTPTAQYFVKAEEGLSGAAQFDAAELDVAQLLRPGIGRMYRRSSHRALYLRNAHPFLPHTVLNAMASVVGEGLLQEAAQRAANTSQGESYCVRVVPAATEPLPAPTLIVLSQRLSFTYRASQTETGLLLDLLQPAPSVEKAIAVFCEANHLPCGAAAAVPPTPAHMVAVHVRVRENSCMYEINFRFRCPDTHFSSFINSSMCGEYMEDCSRDKRRVVNAYERLVEGLRPNKTVPWPTLLIVHDPESSDMVEKGIDTLHARGIPTLRLTGSLMPFTVNVTATEEEAEGLAPFPWVSSSDYHFLETVRRKSIVMTAVVHELVAEYFLIATLPKAFEGNFMSSVSQNVCMKRFHRGLPCNNVFPGFFEYTFSS